MATRLRLIGERTALPTEVDVIFVHGLKGGSESTWASPSTSSQSSWPYWIADAHTDWAVWVADYTAEISALRGLGGPGMAIPQLANNLLHTLQNHGIGERRAIFVCHSLGGLVIKQALRHSSDRNDAPSVAESAAGVVFLAVPHNGSALATMARKLPGITRVTKEVLELEADSDHLEDLDDWFRSYVVGRRVGVAAYAENLPMPGIGIVVEPSSANPHLPEVPLVRIKADHVSISKPESVKSEVYLGVERQMSSWLVPHNAGSIQVTSRSAIVLDRFLRFFRAAGADSRIGDAGLSVVQVQQYLGRDRIGLQDLETPDAFLAAYDRSNLSQLMSFAFNVNPSWMTGESDYVGIGDIESPYKQLHWWVDRCVGFARETARIEHKLGTWPDDPDDMRYGELDRRLTTDWKFLAENDTLLIVFANVDLSGPQYAIDETDRPGAVFYLSRWVPSNGLVCCRYARALRSIGSGTTKGRSSECSQRRLGPPVCSYRCASRATWWTRRR